MRRLVPTAENRHGARTLAMLAFLSLFLSLFLTAAPPPDLAFEPAQLACVHVSIDDADPIVWHQFTAGGNVFALHASGAFTNSGIVDGELVTSTSARAPVFALDEPTVTTSWKDAQGGTHTITTPIVGTTPAARARCIALHEELVKALQALHPPIVP